MKKAFSLSIIFPVYNEAGNIRQTVNESLAFLRQHPFIKNHEIIIVDDGSTDNTAEVLEELTRGNRSVKIVNHARNLGYGKTLISGAKNSRFPWILMMDADGQFKLKSIDAFLKHATDHDIVAGYRDGRKDAYIRILLGKTYTCLASAIFGLRSKDINCGFKLLKRNSIDLTGIQCSAGAFYTNLWLKAKERGCKIKEVPVEHYPRKKGLPTGASLKVIWDTLTDIYQLKFFKSCSG